MPLRPGNMERPGNTEPAVDPALARQYAALYAPVSGEPYAVPAVRLSDIDPQYLRKKSMSRLTKRPERSLLMRRTVFCTS